MNPKESIGRIRQKFVKDDGYFDQGGVIVLGLLFRVLDVRAAAIERIEKKALSIPLVRRFHKRGASGKIER